MEVVVEVNRYTVQSLYATYKELGGLLSEEEFAKASAQNIIDRYHSEEYFDIDSLRSDMGE